MVVCVAVSEPVPSPFYILCATPSFISSLSSCLSVSLLLLLPPSPPSRWGGDTGAGGGWGGTWGTGILGALAVGLGMCFGWWLGARPSLLPPRPFLPGGSSASHHFLPSGGRGWEPSHLPPLLSAYLSCLQHSSSSLCSLSSTSLYYLSLTLGQGQGLQPLSGTSQHTWDRQ